MNQPSALSESVDLANLAIEGKTIHCRVLGSDQRTILRSRTRFGRVPGDVVTWLKSVGDFVGAEKVLIELCRADLRWLNAHAHFVFDRWPKDANLHYAVGARIGEWSLGNIMRPGARILLHRAGEGVASTKGSTE